MSGLSSLWNELLRRQHLKQIDPAIASWIHFKIKYDNLGPDQRRGVWEYFLGNAATPQGALVYSRSDLDYLVEKQVNGREERSSNYMLLGNRTLILVPLQIKNLNSTARALAL